jgi:alpha,alpha-trehalase
MGVLNYQMRAWLLIVVATTEAAAVNDHSTVDRACSVYCGGPLLAAVQTADPPLFNDSKTFVDMPLRVDPEDALTAFAALQAHAANGTVSSDALSAFVETYFMPAGSDLVAATPLDWTATPPRLAHVANDTWRAFGLALNNIWPDLYREVNASVFAAPQRFSLLRRRAGLVLPGGRFRETYYWDSYWIVRGLLVCGMVDTARGVVQNLLDDVSDFGFVPNGGRVYYAQRSQPPLLAPMVVDVVRALAQRRDGHAAAGDDGDDKARGTRAAEVAAAAAFAAGALPLLEIELTFWRDHRTAPGCGGLNR